MAFTSNLRQSPIAEPESGLISDAWAIYFRDQDASIASAPQQVPGGSATLPAQGGAVGTTPIPTGALSPGLYRVSWYARITTPAGSSSSIQVTIGWTDGAVNCQYTAPALTGNVTTAVQSQMILIHIDAASPVSYAVAYSSAPAGMRYALYLVLELVKADS